MTSAWYADETSLVEVVHEAVASNANRNAIVDELTERRFPDTTRRRVEAIVAGAVERRTPDPGKATPSQPTQSNDPPRAVPTRFVEYSDIEHLGDRELSRLVGLILEYFEGSTAFPLLDALDVLWHRQNTTVGIRAVATQNAEKTLDAIQEIADGETNPPDARSPSRLVVVTAAAVDEELTAAASDADVELCGRGQVAQWFRIARLPPSAYGPLLEEGEQSSFDAESVLNELPPLPSRVEGFDPLGLDGWGNTVDIDSWNRPRDSYERPEQGTAPEKTGTEPPTGIASTGDSGSDTPSWETTSDGQPHIERGHSPEEERLDFDAQPAEGKYGHLYADPADDGDFDSLDDWVEGLEEES